MAWEFITLELCLLYIPTILPRGNRVVLPEEIETIRSMRHVRRHDLSTSQPGIDPGARVPPVPTPPPTPQATGESTYDRPTEFLEIAAFVGEGADREGVGRAVESPAWAVYESGADHEVDRRHGRQELIRRVCWRRSPSAPPPGDVLRDVTPGCSCLEPPLARSGEGTFVEESSPGVDRREGLPSPGLSTFAAGRNRVPPDAS